MHYHRRGYGASSPAAVPASIRGDAGDCRALMSVLGMERAHIVGLSFSAAIAMHLAADAPECVHTLTLIEPPPMHTPAEPEFRAVIERLLHVRRERGAAAALEDFLTTVMGPGFEAEAEAQLPGSLAQMRRDAATFFDTDLPALLSWQFDSGKAGRITCPVLHVGGSQSGAFFAESRKLILRSLPQAEDVRIEGATHSLALTHAPEIAGSLSSFLRRHPM